MQVDLTRLLESIANKYPKKLVDIQLKDIPRIAFNIKLIASRKGTDITVCDIGGGIGLFSVGCAALGMKSILVDDFNDSINKEVGYSVLDIHKTYGVEVISIDVIDNWRSLDYESLDVVTTFGSIEHWHHSPKRLFKSLKQSLKSDGLFVIGAPNCVNLRKRIAVPLGYGSWSTIKDWYEPDVFRGHVREPSVSDLIYIAYDIGLKRTAVLGKNWSGHYSGNRLIRIGTLVFDKILEKYPSLCSDIYIIGYK